MSQSKLCGPGEIAADEIIYSDGVSEAENKESEFFEEERLRALISEFKGKTAQEFAAAIWAGVKTFTAGAPQSDDATVLVIRYKGSVACVRRTPALTSRTQ